jgi:DNA polymerase III subunit gamma/tau
MKGVSSSNGETEITKTEPVAETTESTKLSTLEEVEECWKKFLNKVKDDAPQMLYFQILRLQLKELRGSDLHVSADTEFAVKMVEENQQMLSSLFKECTGTFIRFMCRVEKSGSKEKKVISPYERFKEIQKEDPHLRKIVELFGAELEY